jgi:hypothetical protein
MLFIFNISDPHRLQYESGSGNISMADPDAKEPNQCEPVFDWDVPSELNFQFCYTLGR